MNKKLEETLDLEPVTKVDFLESDEVNDATELMTSETIEKIDKISASMPSVRELEASDLEMDEISTLAIDAFKELQDLGNNVEVKYAGEIFGAASNMLGHALTARKNKIERKLNTIELQLKKMRLDIMKEKNSKNNDLDGNETEGKAFVLDRNALISKILEENKK